VIGVDVGGTFTDVVAFRDGRIEVSKVPTDVRETYRSVLAGAAEVGADRAKVFNHASTHGLNAIITRRLPKVAFLTTEGHRDVLDFARVWRPAEAITDPHWRRSFGDVSGPLVPRYLRRGIAERLRGGGEVHQPLDEQQARTQLAVLKRCDVRGVAICLLHSYANDAHERRLRELVAEELGPDVACSISSEVSPLAQEYPRASTTVVDVFMKLIYGTYTARLQEGLAEQGFTGELNFADSAAMLVPADHAIERPYRIVFAGPAAGTSASAHFGTLVGQPNLICADVGGTSCDISVVTDGQPYRNTSFELEHDLIVNSLATDVVSIGAGGGSIVWINPTGEVRVGPDSAGAQPGPACYPQGGERPTVTDMALLVGILDAGRFLDGQMPLSADRARAAFEALETDVGLSERVRAAWHMTLNNIAEGIVNVAIKHGVDVRDYGLMAYGAAGPMLIPALLDHAPVERVVVPPHPGLFSAIGLLSSELVFAESRSAYTVLTPDAAPRIAELYEQMERELTASVAGAGDGEVTIRRTFDGRLVGQSWDTPSVPIPAGPIDADAVAQMVASFHDEYEQRNGNRFEALPVQAVTFRVQVVVEQERLDFPVLPERAEGTPTPVALGVLRHLYEGEVPCPEYRREDLLAGDEIVGPAVVREAMSTTFVPARRTLTVGGRGELVIE
jgi:N-methylhydantoinase A